ncbi:hypothetical protein OSTOST_23529 [Ostertagia ostertagi]
MPRPIPFPRSTSNLKARAASDDFEHPVARSRTRIFPEDTSKLPQKGNQKMPRGVVEELKTKLNNNDFRAIRNSLQSINLRSDPSSFADRAPTHPQYRLFGDTLSEGGEIKEFGQSRRHLRL